MPARESRMLALGTPAPDFILPDSSGKYFGLRDFAGSKGLVVAFICNHCPYVKHIQGELVRLANDYQPRGVAFVAISSNDATGYPEDAPDKMKEVALHLGYPFPYLYDETQDVARTYRAACTPDFYVFDGALRLIYRGRLDEATPGNGKPNDGRDLRAALDAVLAGKPVSADQKPSMGCNIKFRK
ncbi:MAG: thioredoxin family protein [Burkholderiales bacterium]|nr:thioredoxin family protein [Burkholderiales bacterium]